MSPHVPQPDGVARIEVIEAREHGLDPVSISFGRGKFTVLTGPSGSGKSTLALDVIARYSERALRALAIVGRGNSATLPPRPKVREIRNAPPVVALARRRALESRQTIASFLGFDRLLHDIFTRFGRRQCAACGADIRQQTRSEMLAAIGETADAKSVGIFVQPAYGKLFERESLLQLGFSKALQDDGALCAIDLLPSKTDAAVLIDRLSITPAVQSRLREALAVSFSLGDIVTVRDSSIPAWPELFRGSEKAICRTCRGAGLTLSPTLFDLRLAKFDAAAKIGALRGIAGLETTEREELMALAIGDLSLGSTLTTELQDLDGAVAALDDSLADPILLGNLRQRIRNLCALGLGHLHISRALCTLSEGELQRARIFKLTTLSLSGLLYVIDEPSRGLGIGEIPSLLAYLQQLKERGNSLLVIEHARQIIEGADEVITLPAPRVRAAPVLRQINTPLREAPGSSIEKARQFGEQPLLLELRQVKKHNLRIDRLNIPLDCIVCVTGPSGAGKSTLLREVILPALLRTSKRLGKTRGDPKNRTPLNSSGVEGLGSFVVSGTFDAVVTAFDSSADMVVNRWSTVATISGLFAAIRELFVQLPAARALGIQPAHLSLRTSLLRGGLSCPECRGSGIDERRSADNSADAPCPACGGRRFGPQIERMRFKGYSIADLLDLTITDCAEILGFHPKAGALLKLLERFNLGYLRLGQSSRTLSSGELQRVRLAAAMRPRSHRAIYLFDQPSSGLDDSEVENFTKLLRELRDAENGIVMVEHHPLMLARADRLITLGPGAGRHGGRVLS